MANKTIRINIITDTKQMTTGIAQANASLSTMNTTIGRVMRTMTAFAALWAARKIIGGIGESIKAFHEFEQGISKIGILMGDEIGRLREFEMAIEKLASSYGLSTKDILKAGFDILSATNDVNKSLEIMASAAKLAKAGGSDMASTTAGLLTLMESYGNKLHGVVDAGDLMLKWQQYARADIGELSVSISKFLPVSSQMGIRIEELAAVHAQLTRALGNTREASTALGMFLMKLMSPTGAMIKLAQDEWQMSIQRAIATKGLAEVLRVLGGVEIEELAKLVSRQRALKAVSALTNEYGKIMEWTAEIENRQGFMQEKLNIRMADSATKVARAGENFAIFKRNLGEAFIETTNIDDGLLAMTNGLAGVNEKIDNFNLNGSTSIDTLKKITEILNMSTEELFKWATDENIINLWANQSAQIDNLRKKLDELRIGIIATRKEQEGGFGAEVEGRRAMGLPEMPSKEQEAGLTFDAEAEAFKTFWALKVGIATEGSEQLKEVLSQYGNMNNERNISEHMQFLALQQEKIDKVMETSQLDAAEQTKLHALKVQFSVAQKNMLKASAQANLQYAQSTLGELAGLFEMAQGETKKFAGIIKAIRIAETIMATASAVMKALAEPLLPYPSNQIWAATVGAIGAAKVGMIAAQGMQEGGLVPGQGRGDKFPALLEPGELVIPRDMVPSVTNNTSSPTVNISMAGAIVMDDPTVVERLYREHIRERIKNDIRTGRDNFYE